MTSAEKNDAEKNKGEGRASSVDIDPPRDICYDRYNHYSIERTGMTKCNTHVYKYDYRRSEFKDIDYDDLKMMIIDLSENEFKRIYPEIAENDECGYSVWTTTNYFRTTHIVKVTCTKEGVNAIRDDSWIKSS